MSASGVVGPDEGQLHWLGGISARTMVNGGLFPVVATARHGLEMDLSSLPDLVDRFGLARSPEMDG